MSRDRGSTSSQHNWSNRGSFLSKPQQGWLHPDEQLASDAGICYGVRYVGSLGILESMRALDVETRTNITKECIQRICCAVGLKTPSKKSKKNQKIGRYLAAEPNLTYACMDINLTVTIESMTLISMDSGDLLYHHLMPTISFASGGDMDTMDFVAYVAKDGPGRTCHVVECGGGLAQDVIATIGQAFELRFKNLLSEKATPIVVPDRAQLRHEEDYYNDRPGAIPPSPGECGNKQPHKPGITARAESPHYQFPKSNQPVSDQIVETSFNGARDSASSDRVALLSQFHDTEPSGNYCTPHTVMAMGSRVHDPFDMKPFNNVLQNGSQNTSNQNSNLPHHESWFHGKISRQKCDELLRYDGDFLVRESPNSPGQFVLSGRHHGHIRHLLLVDPEGRVRTKDQLFTSVSHLVNYHMLNNVPIVSVDSELLLRTPVLRLADFN